VLTLSDRKKIYEEAVEAGTIPAEAAGKKS
jgi:hypothetical protein